MVAVIPGIPWLCAVFVASLFFGRRGVTVVAVLLASFGWTLVRTDGVTGTLVADYAWRWSATAEDQHRRALEPKALGMSRQRFDIGGDAALVVAACVLHRDHRKVRAKARIEQFLRDYGCGGDTHI